MLSSLIVVSEWTFFPLVLILGLSNFPLYFSGLHHILSFFASDFVEIDFLVGSVAH
jgi:hypothetical protein